MTAESTPTVNRQPMGSQQIRIAVLVVLAVAVGLVLWLVVFHSAKHKKNTKIVRGIPPIAFTAKNLKAESLYINTKFFWAGKRQGYSYEFTRNTKGWLYVRYLPPGVKEGTKAAKHGHFLVIASYPWAGAYKALKDQANGKAVPGPGGSIVYVRPKDHRSVLMAFPGINKQIEIYSPQPAVAIATAESGDIKPVR